MGRGLKRGRAEHMIQSAVAESCRINFESVEVIQEDRSAETRCPLVHLSPKRESSLCEAALSSFRQPTGAFFEFWKTTAMLIRGKSLVGGASRCAARGN